MGSICNSIDGKLCFNSCTIQIIVVLRFNVLLPFEMDLQESTAIKDVLLSPDLFLIKSAKSVKKKPNFGCLLKRVNLRKKVQCLDMLLFHYLKCKVIFTKYSINTDYLLWHTQLIVCAVKSWIIF